MQVIAHEREGKFLELLVEGASYESVVDAYWLGLKRQFLGKSYAQGRGEIIPRSDGSVLVRCEPSPGVTDDQIAAELRFQLKNDKRVSA